MKPNNKLGWVVLFTPIITGVCVLFYINPIITGLVCGLILGLVCFIGWILFICKLFGIETNDPF